MSLSTSRGSQRRWMDAAGLVLIIVIAVLLRPWLVELREQITVDDWPIMASIALWAVFTVYWELEARYASPAESTEPIGSRRVHVFLANIALLFIFVPITRLRQHLFPSSVVTQSIGLGIQGLGFILAVWARGQLGKHWSGEISIKEGHELIRSGPYAMVRHPIYLGLLAMYIGSAGVSGETHAVIGVVLAVFAYLRKIRNEEHMLLKAFGPQYHAYRSNVSALIPKVF